MRTSLRLSAISCRLLVALAVVMSTLLAGCDANGGSSAADAPLVVGRVVGTATFDGAAKQATVTWKYLEGGARFETTVPPRMHVHAISANVPRIMVKLPTELFALRVGDDLVRVIDPPLSLDTDQSVTCSCQMREDCIAGTTFRCTIEGVLAK